MMRAVIICWMLCMAPVCIAARQNPASTAEPADISVPVVLPLAGDWEFRLDPDDVGTSGGWFNAALPDRMRLPGSTDENGKGNMAEERTTERLSRVHPYVGAAWYSKEVNIPAAWASNRITLFLERCHWETTLWIDGKQIGAQNSLSTPHVYEATQWLQPGRHRLTLRVDNRLKIDVGNWAHSVTDETQTNWNGIIGKIELRASNPVWIERAAFYPDTSCSALTARVLVGNATGTTATGVFSLDAPRGLLAGMGYEQTIDMPPGPQEFEMRVPLAPDLARWDEFSPKLHHITVSVSGSTKNRTFVSGESFSVGIHDFRSSGTKLVLNGRIVGLRGTLECCIFPLTGYPPTSIEPWRRIMAIAKEYGLNHMRFHSWCPPKAAFEAADEAGMMLQIECPVWVTDGETAANPARAEFWKAEANRVLDTYGNHPSFCLFSMGNEILLNSKAGDEPFLSTLIGQLQQRDPRHLYTCSTAPYTNRPNDNYFVSHQVDGMIRGQHRIGITDTSTDYDWDDALKETTRPVVSHEIGQYEMFPDFREIPKYTGVTRAHNFEIFRDRLTSAGMADQAQEFFRASGKLSALLYKDEIEAALRSKHLAGFQILDLHDFPGQGTALIGLLNAFWESKGILLPEEFRQFCGPTVPLLRITKREWSSTETLRATAEVAHYGRTDLAPTAARWFAQGADGRAIAQGEFSPTRIPTGGLTPLGPIELNLTNIQKAEKLTLTVTLAGTPVRNNWSVWVFPPQPAPTQSPDLLITHEWNEATTRALADGRSVLFHVPWQDLTSIPGRFQSVFWSAKMFSQPGTMGIVCDPRHGALAGFPTENHSDWQWLDIIQNSGAMILDATPPEFRPVIQAIDDFNRSHKLGYAFEARVGKGRLFACAIELEGNLAARPAALQLRNSILAYVGSPEFRPTHELMPAVLDKIFARPRIASLIVKRPDATGALLHVRAGTHSPMRRSVPWEADADDVLNSFARAGYRIAGRTWRDEQSSAWFGRQLTCTAIVPRNTTGTLYVHFHDWNKQDRSTKVQFEGQDLGTLRKYDGDGVWLALPFTPANSGDGELTVTANSETGPNAMIAEMLVR